MRTKALSRTIISLVVTMSIIMSMGAGLFADTNFTAMTLGTSYNVTNVTDEVGQYYSFTPSETNYYAFSSNLTSGDPYIFIYSDPSMQNEVAHNDDGGEAYNFYLTVSLTANTTYYIKACAYSSRGAEYSFNVTLAPTCTVTYNPNGAEGNPVTDTVVCGLSASAISNPFTRSGYTFLGWGRSATDTYPRYAAGSDLGNIYFNTTLYAIWKADPEPEGITYNGNPLKAGDKIPAYEDIISNNGFTVTIVDQNGNVIKTSSVESGQEYWFNYDVTVVEVTATALTVSTIVEDDEEPAEDETPAEETVPAEDEVPAEEIVPDEEEPEDDSPAPVVLTPEQLRQMSVNNFIENTYLNALGRTYDQSGRQYWSDFLMAGGSAASVVEGFLTSPEYGAKNCDNATFVTILYRVCCNRTPDASEVTNWVNALENGATRSEVIDQFAATPEWASICAYYGVNV